MSRITIIAMWAPAGLLFLAPAPGAPPATDALPTMKGLIWMVGRVGGREGSYMDAKSVEEVIDQNPLIAGLLLHRQWDDLEPAPGQFQWESLDDTIAVARRKERFYKLLLRPGVGTPKWVYDKGASTFQTLGSNPHREDTYMKPVTIPIPWDAVYLEAFEGFIRAVGQRYGADPLCRAVTITGANFQSAEAHLPKSAEDREKWDALDYRDKLAKAYEQYIDIFAEAFPRQQLCLHVSVPIRNDDGVLEKAVVYGAGRYPERFTLQNCQLSGKGDNRGLYSYALIQEYVGRVHVGYQSLAYLGGDRQGSSEASVYNFVRGRGEYWELWQGNGRDPKLCRWLADEIERCRQMGAEAYLAQLKAEGKWPEARRSDKEKKASTPDD